MIPAHLTTDPASRCHRHPQSTLIVCGSIGRRALYVCLACREAQGRGMPRYRVPHGLTGKVPAGEQEERERRVLAQMERVAREEGMAAS